MGPDNPSPDSQQADSDRATLEKSCAQLHEHLAQTERQLEGFQGLMARRELVINSLNSFRALEQLGYDNHIVVTKDVVDVLGRELEKLEEKFKEYQLLMYRRNAVRGALDHNERLLGEPIGMTPIGERSVWEGAKEILIQKQEPMSAKEITDALIALGWHLSGKTPVEAVRTTLIRKIDVFERVEGGKFRLKDRPWELKWLPQTKGTGLQVRPDALRPPEFSESENIGIAERKQREKRKGQL